MYQAPGGVFPGKGAGGGKGTEEGGRDWGRGMGTGSGAVMKKGKGGGEGGTGGTDRQGGQIQYTGGRNLGLRSESHVVTLTLPSEVAK